MNREYIGYVGDACKNGMSPEEVQSLFNDIMQKSNTRNGKRVLRLFAQGVGNSKKRVMVNKANVARAAELNQANITQQQPQISIPQMQKTIGAYKQ